MNIASTRSDQAGDLTAPATDRKAIRVLRALSLGIVVALFANVAGSIEPPPAAAAAPGEPVTRSAPEPVRKNFELPGLVVNFQERSVDLEATVCLEEGFLELIACAKGSKEHESIVAIRARPMHVHTALLLLGANNGHPAMRQAVDEMQTRWVNVPPQGDPIDVFLVVASQDGKRIERPIGDFIVRSCDRVDEVDGAVIVAPDQAEKSGDEKEARLPHTFLFAGSQLRDAGDGPRQYLADASGNVISIATFGDEVLGLPFHQTQQDGALTWRIKPESLPKVGTKVSLRLRPKRKTAESLNARPAPGKDQDAE